MKRALIFLAVLAAQAGALPTDAVAAEQTGVGPLRIGMSYDAVRAATPGAVWKPMAFRGIETETAFNLGGQSFGAQVTDGPWDRYRILAFHVVPLVDVASCRSDFEKATGAIAQAVGELRAPPSFSDGEVGTTVDQQTVAIAGGSALMLRHVAPGKPESAWLTELSATWKEGATTLNATAETRAAADGNPPRCVIRIALSDYVKRPRKGTVAFDDLVFGAVPGIGRLHHSLDGVTAPSAPVDLSFDCTIDDQDGHLDGCTPRDGAQSAPYLGAALQRLSDYQVTDKTRSGKWTPGERTVVTLRLAPSDRRDGLVVDSSKQGQLVFTAKPRTEEMVRYYPREAMAAGAGSEISLGCVVQTDLTAVCPEIAVSPGPYQAAFRAAASQIVTLYRAAPALRDGASAVGTGFRTTLTLSP